MNLYFKRSNGEIRLVKENATKDTAYNEIVKEVHRINPQFKIYYVRMWGDDNEGYTFDVGSHSEFFYLCEEDQICLRQSLRGL